VPQPRQPPPGTSTSFYLAAMLVFVMVVSAAASSYLYIGLQRDHERLNALEKEIAHLNQIIGEASPKGEVRPQVPAIEVKVTPEDVLLPASGKQLMASEVQNSENKRVKWSINPPGLGSISSTGMYKAPASVRQETQVTVIATSLANPSVSGSAHITLWPNGHPAPLDIDVRPKGQSLRPSESWAFRAYVTGAGSHEVIWSIDPADRGSINPKTGSYTAPSTLPDKNATVMIIATSEADPTKKATLIVTHHGSGRAARVWLTLDGAVRTTAVPDVQQVSELAASTLRTECNPQ